MTAVDILLNVAKNELGYLEKASNKDLYDKTANAGKKNYTKFAYEMDTKYSGFYNGRKNGHAWCDVFADWCFVTAFGVENAKKMLCQPSKSLGAGCKYSMNYYKKAGRFYALPKVGDQIFFYNSGKTGIAHTGIVCDVDNKYVYTIEGNTSSASGVIANGGSVRDKRYLIDDEDIAGYGRPLYEDIEVDKNNNYKIVVTVLEWQKAAIKDGFKFPKYGADGKWGAECESVAKKAVVKKQIIGYKYPELTKIVQKVVGVTVDGKCGSKTKTAIKTYQKQNGLTADGCVGLKTWKKILGIKK